MVEIDRLQHVIGQHLGNHIIGRTDQVILRSAGRNLRVHDLIGLEFFVDNLDSGLFFKIRDHIRIHIFSPVVDDNLFLIFCLCDRSGKNGKYGCKQRKCKHFFHVGILLENENVSLQVSLLSEEIYIRAGSLRGGRLSQPV